MKRPSPKLILFSSLRQLLLNAFILFLCGRTSAQVPTLVDLYDASVFSLEAYDEFGVRKASGTGFFISDSGDAVTSYSFLRLSLIHI